METIVILKLNQFIGRQTSIICDNKYRSGPEVLFLGELQLFKSVQFKKNTTKYKRDLKICVEKMLSNDYIIHPLFLTRCE